MDDSFPSRIAVLGDLDLALLVSLVAEVHCVFSTAAENTRRLQEELRLSCSHLFGLQPAIVECSASTSVDEFNEAVLVDNEDHLEDVSDGDYTKTRPSLMVNFTPIHQSNAASRTGSVANLDERRIANVVIATNLDAANDNVQVQAFELLRSGRIFTRSAMHTAPKNMLFIAINSRPGARLSRHLNDVFCISHHHFVQDGLPRLDQGFVQEGGPPIFPPEDIAYLTEQVQNVDLTGEIAQYLHNVSVFMRNSRYVKAGVTATATRQLRILSLALAPLHGLDYVPPSLVALAARKIYAHRLVLATPENEKSLLWGSDPRAIRQLLDGVTVEDVIEDVLASIDTPL